MSHTDQHRALIYIMVSASAADGDISDQETHTIGESFKFLPIFRDFNLGLLPQICNEAADLLQDEEGLDAILAFAQTHLDTPRLKELAYALACEVVATDGHLSQEELRLLELIRHALTISRLTATAIEHCVQIRYSMAS